MGKKARIILILGGIIWFLVMGLAFSQEKKDFLKMMQDMKNFHSDFRKFSEIHSNNPLETRISLDLKYSAEQIQDYLSALATLSIIFQEIFNNADKKRIVPTMNGFVDLFLGVVDSRIEMVDGCIGITEVPGIAITATRFNEELREIRDIFSPIRQLK